MRSSGHSGSGWLSQLFQTQRLAFFFEFTGRCEKGRNVTVELDRTFEEGCSCARSAVPLARLAAACRRPLGRLHNLAYTEPYHRSLPIGFPPPHGTGPKHRVRVTPLPLQQI